MCGLPLDLGGKFKKKGAREHVERRNAPYLLLNFCRHNGIAGDIGETQVNSVNAFSYP